ncbi:polyamine ABC transporter substrate-binding protein [Amphritea sp. 2_MG-2023]|uniref:polyamine ABC transporter substrate-binding protein n=1 Tax=Amphritea TaxID=515417 RepID=UPI001C06A29D|nr:MULTISPECIES: polyamine ABC transporter substrate-binding protein [Amphritea]MBU2966814.1 polyamine ABC transporter substrate-binding protein [Amphritea atlantica]MDO6420655.1 polyamine ABC transporter substrate-binding protein [Amphritea sp. 2_MG-2023]MDX2423704.1 polyamine ABC transporter substrate-binding protein [Amphritea sp.]
MTKTVPYLIRKALQVSTLGLAATVPLAQAEEVLNFYNWSDYIAEDTLAKFEAETGIKVVYDVYDSNETLEAKLLAGHSGYDLVVPSSHFMEQQIKAGIFQKLQKDKLSNLGNLDPSLMKLLDNKDQGNQYGVPYLWGTTGIGYNVKQVQAALGVDAPVDSWDLVFNPENMKKLADCGVTFLDSPDEIYPLALLYTGQSSLDTSTTVHKNDSPAAKALKAVRPYLRQFSSSQYVNDLANGDICVAIGYSGDIFQAQARAEEAGNGNEIAYSIPKEGTEIWFDMLLIPSDAKHAENAHKFINFLLRPDIIADITNYVWYANPNLASTDLVDPDITSDPAIYPDTNTRDRLYMPATLPAKTARVRSRTWSNIKTGK